MRKYYLHEQILPLLLLLIFIGSCNGQVKTSPKHSGPTDSLSEPKTITGNQPRMIRTQGAGSGNVGCELQDKAGNLWFSTGGEGVYRYDGKSFTNYLPSADYYRSNEDGRSMNHNLPKTTYSQPQDSISDNMIFSISEDKAGNLWFATRRHGACRYDGKSFTSFREQEGFVSKGVYAILEDKKGNMWLTTDDNGVWCYDGTSFKNFTTNDGLINDSVFSVLEDKNGNLWFGTRGFGLSRYDGKTFTSFSE